MIIPRSAEIRSITASKDSGDRLEPYSERSRSLAMLSKLRNVVSDSLTGSSEKESKIERGRNVEATLGGA